MSLGFKKSALVLAVVLAGSLLVLYPVCGDNPSYSECRPHIDATIRDLAAKAIIAGETPSDNLDYASAEGHEEAPAPLEAPPPPPEAKPEPEVPKEEPPAPPPPTPAPIEPAPEVAPPPPPAPEPVVAAPEPKPVVEAPPPAPAAPVVQQPPEPVRPVELAPQPVPSTPQPAAPTAQKPADQKLGFFDKLINAIFGIPKVARDPKWAQPWQTHPEHAKKVVEKAPEVEQGPVGPSGGLIDKLVKIIFPTVPAGTKRDPKWAQPWQTHPEHARKAAPVVEEPKEVGPVGPSGGLIDKLVKLLFVTVPEGAKRDPKWAQPWQTHPEHAKKAAPVVEEPKEVRPVGPSGGIIDKFVKLLFATVPEGAKRDPKWAQPWQTHPEHAKKAAPVVAEPKETGPVGPSGGIIDKLVKMIFVTVPEGAKRDPKWAQPWQTHPEHAKKIVQVTKEPKEEGPVGPSGGIIDKFVKLVFETVPEGAQRDPKWAKPWQTHPEHRKEAKPIEQPPPPPAPKPAPVPEPVVTPKPAVVSEPVAAPAPPVKAPEPEPVKAPEPEPVKVPEPEPIKVPAPEPVAAPAPKPIEPAPAPAPEVVKAPEPAPELKKVVEEPIVEKVTFPEEKAAVPSEPAKAAPVDTKPLADAPEAPKKPVLAEEVKKEAAEEEDEQIVVVPSAFRSRDRLESILGLDESSRDTAARTDPIAEATLKDLKRIYETTIKPLESLYKYQDISNRHVSDAELFGTPLILMLGPYSTGKSTFINYMLGVEYTKRGLKTGTPPSHGVFRIIQHGDKDTELDGTDLSAHWSFTSLQKFGQNFIDQIQGKVLQSPLLKKVTFVEAPGILEMRRPGERLYPYNDVVQWFIDRADLILVMFDYTKLDAGYEMEAILDQLKGREAQTRILLNKADQVPPEELIKVQGSLFWNLSPLLGVSTPPTVYAGSFASRPYRPGSPAKLFEAQEDALLTDIAQAINSRVDNRIAIARRHAVRVRNHAQMVDTYLTTYYKNKGFLTSKHKLAEDIIENPHNYNIYEGMSLLTNISRYDLPDPEVYRDFFRVHNLYDFQTLKDTCSYFRGCPLSKIDGAISHDLPELLDRHRRLLEAAKAGHGKSAGEARVPTPGVRGGVPPAAHVRTS